MERELLAQFLGFLDETLHFLGHPVAAHFVFQHGLVEVAPEVTGFPIDLGLLPVKGVQVAREAVSLLDQKTLLFAKFLNLRGFKKPTTPVRPAFLHGTEGHVKGARPGSGLPEHGVDGDRGNGSAKPPVSRVKRPLPGTGQTGSAVSEESLFLVSFRVHRIPLFC
jgi:hypothetical protein